MSQQSNNNNGSRSDTINTTNYISGIENVDKNCSFWAYVSLLQNKNKGKGNACWHCNYCTKIYKVLTLE